MFKGLFTRVRSHRLTAGVSILAFTQFSASVAGLVRDRVLNATFIHNLGVVDAYIAAFRPSDLLFQTCIMSAIGTVLVPILAQYKAKNNDEEMSNVLSSVMTTAGIIFGLIALVLGLCFPLIAPYLVQFTGPELDLYIQFGRLALLTNFLFVFGNALGQYLITIEKYWMYGITPILYTCGTILGTILLTPYYGSFGPIFGTLLGAIAYVLLRFVAVIRSGTSLSFSWWHIDLKEMGVLMVPRILSLGAFQIQLLFLDRIASGFAEGSVTINNAARNFQSVLVGVVGIAVAQSVYSILSQSAAVGDEKRFMKFFRTGILLCLSLTIPGAAALVMAAPLAAHLVHLASVYNVFFLCILLYAISIPFESISHLQLRAFYAMKNTLIPAIWGILGGVSAILCGYLLMNRYGIYSIAIGYTVGEIVQTVGLWIMLPRRTKKLSMDSLANVPERQELGGFV